MTIILGAVLSDHLADKFNPIKTKTSSLLHHVTDQTTFLDNYLNYLVNSIGNSISSSWNNWLLQHPIIAWLFNHPLIGLVSCLLIVILTMRLLATIYRAIANVIDRLWLWILRSPWLLLRFLFGWSTKPTTGNTTVTNYEVTNNPEQLQEILTRLEQIQQQQEQIIQDLAQLKQEPLTIKPQQLQLAEKSSQR